MNNTNLKFPDRLFITGIDTDAGKTYATGWIARQLMQLGESVITQKFVQTGNVGFSEDIEAHRKIMGIPYTEEDKAGITAPIIFSYPASADLAAKIDNKTLDLSLIDNATDTLSKKYEHVLIEGAGGLMVPLIGQYLTIDYVRERKLPVALVTNGRLGSINHTLLSLQAIKDNHIPLFAVIYNSFFDKDETICNDTRIYIQNWIKNHFPSSKYLEF